MDALNRAGLSPEQIAEATESGQVLMADGAVDEEQIIGAARVSRIVKDVTDDLITMTLRTIARLSDGAQEQALEYIIDQFTSALAAKRKHDRKEGGSNENTDGSRA